MWFEFFEESDVKMIEGKLVVVILRGRKIYYTVAEMGRRNG